MATDREDIMERLKQETQEHHQHAEERPLAQAMFHGTLPRDSFVAFLSQRFLVHRALEKRLRALGKRVPTTNTVLHERQFQEPTLREDLRYWGCDPEAIVPIRETEELLREIERVGIEEPIALLGMHYVLEGSKNGAKIIAHRVRRAYGLTSAAGTAYFDPHGDQQRSLWRGFKEAMADLELTEAQRARIVEAAQYTFTALAAIDDALFSSVADTPVAP